MEDVKYFRQKLLQSLNVPISRLEQQQGGMIGVGRTAEVTRDEVKFTKFIMRLRNKFAQIFDHALRTQLVLKGICTAEEWDEFRESIYYDYIRDNHFTEMRDTELLRERIATLNVVDPYIGRFYSANWVKRNVLQMSTEEIEDLNKEMKEEEAKGIGGPTQMMLANQQQQQADEQQYPPEDNTQDNDSQESKTPELDSNVIKYSQALNRK